MELHAPTQAARSYALSVTHTATIILRCHEIWQSSHNDTQTDPSVLLYDTAFSTAILAPSPGPPPRFHLTADKLWEEALKQGQHKPCNLAFSNPGLPHQKLVKANLSSYEGQINNLSFHEWALVRGYLNHLSTFSMQAPTS